MFFFFNDTATTEIYTLSLHDALPIWSETPTRRGRSTSTRRASRKGSSGATPTRGSPPSTNGVRTTRKPSASPKDRKSTRLNSSHANISYAVFCLKKKKRYNRLLNVYE